MNNSVMEFPHLGDDMECWTYVFKVFLFSGWIIYLLEQAEEDRQTVVDN